MHVQDMDIVAVAHGDLDAFLAEARNHGVLAMVLNADADNAVVAVTDPPRTPAPPVSEEPKPEEPAPPVSEGEQS